MKVINAFFVWVAPAGAKGPKETESERMSEASEATGRTKGAEL